MESVHQHSIEQRHLVPVPVAVPLFLVVKNLDHENHPDLWLHWQQKLEELVQVEAADPWLHWQQKLEELVQVEAADFVCYHSTELIDQDFWSSNWIYPSREGVHHCPKKKENAHAWYWTAALACH